MTLQELTSIAENPDSTPEELRDALHRSVSLIADYADCLHNQEVTGETHYLIRMAGRNERPQLTVTGPDPQVEERLCELLASYLYMWGVRAGAGAEQAAIQEATKRGARIAMMGVRRAIDEVCPEHWDSICTAMSRHTKS